jgi:hypothetical protein
MISKGEYVCEKAPPIASRMKRSSLYAQSANVMRGLSVLLSITYQRKTNPKPFIILVKMVVVPSAYIEGVDFSQRVAATPPLIHPHSDQ